MKHTTEELIKLWSNDKKRCAFVDTYKEWDIFAQTPELMLKFYKYDLTDGSKLIVMEHMQKVYYTKNQWETSAKYFLQKGEYFVPNSVGVHTIAEHLKGLKAELIKSGRDTKDYNPKLTSA